MLGLPVSQLSPGERGEGADGEISDGARTSCGCSTSFGLVGDATPPATVYIPQHCTYCGIAVTIVFVPAERLELPDPVTWICPSCRGANLFVGADRIVTVRIRRRG